MDTTPGMAMWHHIRPVIVICSAVADLHTPCSCAARQALAGCSCQAVQAGHDKLGAVMALPAADVGVWLSSCSRAAAVSSTPLVPDNQEAMQLLLACHRPWGAA
jgi:hypothetical protein